jgi:hypothetical protein
MFTEMLVKLTVMLSWRGGGIAVGDSFNLLNGDHLTVNGLAECSLTPPIERQILTAAAITFFPTLVCIKLLTRKHVHNQPFLDCVLW